MGTKTLLPVLMAAGMILNEDRPQRQHRVKVNGEWEVLPLSREAFEKKQKARKLARKQRRK